MIDATGDHDDPQVEAREYQIRWLLESCAAKDARIAELEDELADARATIDDMAATIETLIARNNRADRERDEARANYAWMVRHAADERLDGYRELGQRAATAERERDEALEVLREVSGAVFRGHCPACGGHVAALSSQDGHREKLVGGVTIVHHVDYACDSCQWSLRAILDGDNP